ncbi:hypothetical protein HBI56_053360 [Parastagonospora nodorum]|nr:hypothetical protein HBH51_158970 [Parastagonospora nodorum]KAH3981417.1 hypothetical protein HBH52_086590 [Parastagonospora nodorum]KAH4002957.1 hypothetical protein HBI10_066350 [Parastagonospora nodorum]KAH4022709.1 hypothetical protein HBI09_166600 [Parastagonospora nodorum]KAH4070248.1 hypothetical protein HBH50_096290 [Parastagonospora nodorum]
MSWMDPHENAINRYRNHFRCNKTHGVILDSIYMSRDTLEGLMRDDEECVVEHVNSGQSDFRDSQDLASLAAIRQKYGRGKK